MPESDKPLGKLVAIYALAPEYVQRAIFIAVLAFLFFLATLIMFYIRQNILYFLLASAFLVVYLVTLFSWIMQRRSVVKIYAGGISFKNQTAVWSEISSVNDRGCVTLESQKQINLPKMLNDLDGVIRTVRSNISR